jgi:hypothetical protein
MATKIIEYTSLDQQYEALRSVNKRKCLYGEAHRLPAPYSKRSPLIKEAAILQETKRILTHMRIWHRRIDTAGKILHTGAGTTMIPGSMKGLPDILGCLPDGRLLGLECKAPGGTVSAEQYSVLMDLSALGACVAIVVDPNKLEYFLAENECTCWLEKIVVV